MIFTRTSFPDIWIIEPEKLQDERGFFARAWCEDEMRSYGLNTALVQCNISFSHRKGTLRGLHYQAFPHAEVKLIRCTRGAIYDVVVDLRPESPTFKKWMSVELTADNYKMFYIPVGCAHGFQTLSDDTEVFYQMSEFHHPECAGGVRWDDPAFSVKWPLDVTVISEKDLCWPDCTV
ncbi:MAG: dTDP-4-dehydrorhamnose 3,5-epimerase [Anaerolineae bacterium]|nr:dTDP-4-dehydrorhamnose 3,5-epimerase [Anaerolineae bacterium]